MSAPLVTPSRDALAKALRDHQAVATGLGEWCCKCSLTEWRPSAHRSAHVADAILASGAVIDAATLTDDETVRAVAYRFAEGEATYAASTVRHVLRALVDVLAERGEQHG